MDLIKNLMAEKKTEITAMLMKKAGFGAAQAESFVPAATEEVAKVAGASALDPKALAGLDVSQLLGKIDLASLASKTGMDKGMVTAGLTSILPMILEAMRGKLGIAGNLAGMAGKLAGGAGLGNAAAGGGLGGAIKGVGGLFKS